MAPGKKDEQGEKQETGEPHYGRDADGSRPEARRRHPKRERPHPISAYSTADSVKILLQENRVVCASLVGSLISQTTLVHSPILVLGRVADFGVAVSL
jgi:hypothetical protein